jgi:hypothetical protein
MATTGRKDLCPCGSGQTYERCCLSLDAQNAGRIEPEIVTESQGISNDFRSRMVSSDDLEAMCGLSREEMYYLLYDPFSSPELVSFNLELNVFPDSPFFRLFHYLLKGMATQELKPTAKGNLPPKFVNEAAVWYYGEKEYIERKKYFSFRTEDDFPVLNTVRLITQLSGLIRKYKNRFYLTKNGKDAYENGLNGRIFLKIFKTYTTRFNWGYNDRYPELHIVQQAFLFTLYLLSRLGDTFRPASVYEDMFAAAFPEEVPNVPVVDDAREETLKRCYSLRSLSRYAHFFGFIERSGPSKARLTGNLLKLKKTRFLDEWVKFHR